MNEANAPPSRPTPFRAVLRRGPDLSDFNSPLSQQAEPALWALTRVLRRRSDFSQFHFIVVRNAPRAGSTPRSLTEGGRSQATPRHRRYQSFLASEFKCQRASFHSGSGSMRYPNSLAHDFLEMIDCK